MSGGKLAVSALTVVVLAGAGFGTRGQLTSAQTEVAAEGAQGSDLRVEVSDGDVTVVAETGVAGPRAQGRVVSGLDTATWGFDGAVFRSSCDGVGWPSPCGADWTITVPAGATVDVRADAGDVRLVGAFDAASVTTTAGDVVVAVPHDAVSYRLSGRSPRGERTVEVPLADDTTGTLDDATRTLDLTTGAGDVTVTKQ